MDECDRLTREELVALMRKSRADRAAPCSRAVAPAGLPVFGERALREFENSASPMRIFDFETLRYLAVNDAAVKFYGYTREEFLTLTAKDIRHPEEHAVFMQTLTEQAEYLRYRPLRRQVKKSGEIVVVEAITQDVLFDGRRARLSLTIDVTGRKRMQDLLWRRQQEFETLAENIPHLVARFDRNRRFVYVNSAVEKLLGVPRHQLIGRTQRELGMPEEVAAKFAHSLDIVLRGAETHGLEFSLATAGGERLFEACHVPERDTSGELSMVLCIAHDVTERSRSESVLRETNEFLRSIIESSRNCIKVLDLDGNLLMMNDGGRRLLEIDDLAPLINTSWIDLWPVEERDKARAALATAADGRVSDFEGYAPTLKGSPRWWETTLTPILGADGKPARLLAVSREISRRKQSRDLESRLAAIVNNSMDAIISKDLGGIISTWNPGAERLFGYRADEAVGQPVTILIPPERREEETLILDNIRSGRRVDTFETVRCRKDGTRVHVSLAISPIKDKDGNVIGISKIVRDITERKQAELAQHRSAALARLLESLARAANEALTPEAAMAACLERICGHGRWAIGRVAVYGENGHAGTPPRSIWYAPDREPFADFIDFSNRFIPDLQGSFYNRVLRERAAVWMEDLQTGPDFGRREAAIAHGLRSAFAFPIIARGVVAAVMEVFARETRPQDPLALGAAYSIASQLARIVEREWAYQANARMAAIVESSRDAIVSRNLEGTILTWNRAAERLLGYTAEEIIGRDVRMIIPSELHEGMLDRQAMLRRGSSVPARETVRIARDGRRIDVLTSPATIRDSRGEICGISTIIRDITERKQAEQELRQAQQRLQVAVHGGGVGLWDWDLGTGVVYFSPEWKQQLGYEEHDIPDAIEEWQSRIHPDDRARVSAELEEFLVQRRSEYRSEFRLRHKDGTYRWILSRASAQLGENGNVERMFGCHVDVTDQKQAEAERLENAVRQRDALVREVHHRIKNSLQGVAGLLRQKIRKYPAIAPGIEEAIAQLQSVALVYGLQETRSDGLLSLADVTDAICSSAESLIGGRVERAFERRSQRAACVAGPEAVSVAVALNELVFNALKHHPAAAGKKLIRVALRETPAGAEIRIANRGRLPKGFDFAEGRAVGNGLGLVRTLLASPGGNIRFSSARNEVEVVVKLSAPLLSGPKQAITRRVNDEDAKARREAAAYPGGGRRPAGARSIG